MSDVLSSDVLSARGANLQSVGPSPANNYFARNSQWMKPGQHTFNTQLPPEQEAQFRAWLSEANPQTDPGRAEFDVSTANPDYDMRGFWLAKSKGDERATERVAPDGYVHRSDYWKTPYHKSFSAESQWADPKKAPHWNEKDQLVLSDGTVVYDEGAKKK